jgi:hypothetical protein
MTRAWSVWVLSLLLSGILAADARIWGKEACDLAAEFEAYGIENEGWNDPGGYQDPGDCQYVSDVPLVLSVPCLAPGFDVRAGLLYLQPSSDDLGYAVVTFEENFSSPVPIATPYWVIESFEPDYEPGFEVGARYAFARPGANVQMNWQRLRSKTLDFIPPMQETGQWVSPFSQTGPPEAETYQEMLDNTGVNDLRYADGRLEFAYDSVDLDLGQQVNVGSAVEFRLLAGLRYARLQEQLVSNFYGWEPPAGTPFPESVQRWISLNNTSNFWGVGPRVGLDTACNLGGGWRVTGNFAGALLMGRKQPAQYLFRATTPELAAIGIDENVESIASGKFSDVVSAFDARLGLAWAHQLQKGGLLSLDVGVMASVYNNAFMGYETNNNVLALQIGSLSTASMRQTESDFTLHGFYLTGGYKW